MIGALVIFVNHEDKYLGDVSGTSEDLRPTVDDVPQNIIDEIDTIVGWYCQGYYEGSGFAIVKTLNNGFKHLDLGHCSCYGPWDGYDGTSASWEEMVEMAKKNPDWFEREKATWEEAARVLIRIFRS